MLLDSLVLEVADADVAVRSCLEGLAVGVQLGVDEVGDNVRIAGESAVFDDEALVVSLLG